MRTHRRPMTRRFINRCIALAEQHRDWTREQVEAEAFKQVVFGIEPTMEYTLCNGLQPVEGGKWICCLDAVPAVSGEYRVRLFTGVERNAYWNNERGCWQLDAKPAKGRNVHKQLQKSLFSRNAFWHKKGE